ncbi:sporulation protein YhbH [Desulfitobacterium dichloroeliminans LMG P-21439]|uniref:Sporulation protein YhbH n=1 Tax=Desulfitobacterium dichloroeliminans (strain LMG P-21439 / DCA1) TaxID=871963 RepID=L0F9C8_DESDL|nr:sporulation protein YhbH [Desulfitobacterium dichloroeliminans]AGA69523.1 sporulation protein YhbH [Desulfitobacterium dichloroeliminans LMG P-21439]
MSDDIIVSREDWSLHRKGYLDQSRHKEKVQEVIKKQLGDLIVDESIIISDGKKTMKVPMRSLEEFRFRFDYNKRNHTGQGNKKMKDGEILARDNARKHVAGNSQGAGEEPGIDIYEAEVTYEDLAAILFDELQLPNLDDKKRPLIAHDKPEFRDIRKKGLMANIDKKRTLIESIKRQALAGKRQNLCITPEDLRFKTWETHPNYETNAVIIAMMDTSGSMGQFEKYISRTFFFWMVRFLREKYENVEMRFLAHHTEAKEVTEEEFFTRGESGGTRCSSVYQLALEMIQREYPPAHYNIYPVHFTDGDNIGSDNTRAMNLMQKLVEISQVVGYGEILRTHYSSTLMTTLRRIADPKLRLVTIRDRQEVYEALKTVFS